MFCYARGSGQVWIHNAWRGLFVCALWGQIVCALATLWGGSFLLQCVKWALYLPQCLKSAFSCVPLRYLMECVPFRPPFAAYNLINWSRAVDKSKVYTSTVRGPVESRFRPPVTAYHLIDFARGGDKSKVQTSTRSISSDRLWERCRQI